VGEISKAFLEGMQEIYRTMFCTDIMFTPMDITTIETNVYHDIISFSYLSPIALAGKVSVTIKENEEPLKEVEYDLVFEFPAKEFDDHSILHTPQDFNTLMKAKITHMNMDYDIQYIQPINCIEGVYLIYRFYCNKTPKKSGETY
jgi:S-ribosylhomocysteine lyase LuxS involved in autoinducer biosynthesis